MTRAVGSSTKPENLIKSFDLSLGGSLNTGHPQLPFHKTMILKQNISVCSIINRTYKAYLKNKRKLDQEVC